MGIGTGLLAEQLADAGIELSGFDFSPDMLKRAATRLGDRVKLYLQDVLNLDLPEAYEAAVSQGGVWVATKDGNCLDSHITGYDRNLQGLRNVAKYLDDNGLFIINLGPDQSDLTMKLAERADYSQRVKFVGDNFEKDYFVKKDGKILAHQHVKYARFNPEQTARIIYEAGFRKLGIDESQSFVVYEKSNH